MADAVEATKRRRADCRSVFCGKNGELHPVGERVIANLREMTGYGNSPFRADPVAMAYEVGKQDVFRHLMQVLNITDADIYRRFTASNPNNEEGYFEDAY